MSRSLQICYSRRDLAVTRRPGRSWSAPIWKVGSGPGDKSGTVAARAVHARGLGAPSCWRKCRASHVITGTCLKLTTTENGRSQLCFPERKQIFHPARALGRKGSPSGLGTCAFLAPPLGKGASILSLFMCFLTKVSPGGFENLTRQASGTEQSLAHES